MKLKYITTILMILGLMSCDNDKDILVPIPNDINFENLELERFSYSIPEGGFNAGEIHFNAVNNVDGSYSGFAVSNRNNRSFTWTGSSVALDTNIYSVYTKTPNRTKKFAVAHVKGDDTYFTLDNPKVIEHILVANTTYSFLAMMYGTSLGTESSPAVNINLPGQPIGVWHTYAPGVTKMTTDSDSYLKLIIKGYSNGQEKGIVEFFLCKKENVGGEGGDGGFISFSDTQNSDSNLKFIIGGDTGSGMDYIIDDWYKVNLESLGEVDKVVFYLESSDVDVITGEMFTPAYFCLDGIRIKN